MEGFQGEKKRLMLTYDEHDVVTKVGTITVPKKKKTVTEDSKDDKL